MSEVFPHLVDYRKTTIGGLLKNPQFVNTHGMAEEPRYPEIGARLKALREGLSDLSQKDWAEKHGFNGTQYNNWEKGVRRITVDAAEVLCDAYGLTLDAIYRGKLAGSEDTARNVLLSTLPKTSTM